MSIRFVPFFFMVILLTACIPQRFLPRDEPQNIESSPVPDMIIRALNPSSPFWFELNPEGPELTPSPAEASLFPVVPWTQALHVSAFLPDSSGTLYAGINRWGILKLEVQEEETAFYYFKGDEIWKSFPILSLFLYEDKPAALLGRDRFFAEPGLPAPAPALWTIAAGGSLEPVSLPALEAFSTGASAQSGEINALFQGKNNWHFRLFQPGEKSVFLAAVALSLTARETSADEFAQAQEEVFFTPPSLLAWVMSETERLMECSSMALVVSPEFSGARFFRTGTPARELEFFGYYRPPLPNMEGAAILLLPDGSGVYCFSDGKSQRDGQFSLPPTGAKNIVYTGAALAGKNLLAVSWEERTGWNIGTAGFLLLKIDW